ncbi:MAG: hypothetical protein CMJ76_16760 [Planctomycetaceae bacterium]|nr:hypothetical protein [Planctomycetaceae bacterium]
MSSKKQKPISIPWMKIFVTSLLMGAYITFVGSFGIVSLAIVEGIGAAFLYLSYVPAIILAIGLLVFIGASIMILIHSFRWARYLVCLFGCGLAAIPLTPIVLMPHFFLGSMIFGFSASGFGSSGEIVCVAFFFLAVLAWTLWWSRGLYRISKKHRPALWLWRTVEKYANDTKGSQRRLRKLIKDFSHPTLVPEKIKKKFRRSH